MKIVREHYRAGPGRIVVNGYVKANPIERMVLTRMMREGRHNLRPSHNWPGLRRHGASFILAAKGASNPDHGPRPGYPDWLEKALVARYGGMEMWGGFAGLLLMGQGFGWVGGGVAFAALTVPRLLNRLRNG